MSEPTPNSAEFWLPALNYRTSQIPVPFTAIVPYDHRATMVALEDGGEWVGFDALVADVWRYAQAVGPPAFLRTDLASAKHDGPSAYRIDSEDDVGRVISDTVSDNEMKFWLGGPTPRSFLVRQWLDLAAPFTAFGGHPIAREWRYFASADGVASQHFYWPESAIEFGTTDPEWPKLLAEMAADEPPSVLATWAVQAAAVVGEGEWSVDFAQDRSEKWWLIDMATAGTSWHPEHDT